jgi:hypothetical protein
MLGKSTIKWPAYLSTFVLNWMCSIIKSGVRIEKGFKEVHLNDCAKKIFEYCQQEVSSTQDGMRTCTPSSSTTTTT